MRPSAARRHDDTTLRTQQATSARTGMFVNAPVDSKYQRLSALAPTPAGS